MRTILILFLLLSSMSSCSNNDPSMVQGEISFGKYKITPPSGYWYFPRPYPNEITDNEYYLLSFFKDKNVDPEHLSKKGFFNVGVFKNSYSDINQYYQQAKQQGLEYEDLPNDINQILNLKDWNCKKHKENSFYVIECITLKKDLLTVALIGENESKALNEIDLFKTMLVSVNKNE